MRRMLLLGGVVTLCCAAISLWRLWPASPPPFAAVRAAYRSSYTVVRDRHGEVVQEVRADRTDRRCDWTELADISPAVSRAVLESEDRDFVRHHGVDWPALLLGAAQSLQGRTRGASTISMQVASQLRPELRPVGGRRSVSQKLRQMLEALELERSWTKDQILECYLNLVTFRSELTGINAASWGLYRVAPASIGSSEACLLASLIPSPNASAEEVAGRAFRLATRLGIPADRATITAQAAQYLAMPYGQRPVPGDAPLIGRQLVGPAEVCTTLDARVQRFAADLLRRSILGLHERHVHDGAVLVVDNDSGDVLAYVGNAGDAASADQVDGVRARRQTGSILKPFLYARAFELRLLTPASLLEDSPLNIQTPRGLYNPSNYDHSFHGVVTARAALASSLNVPAVRTLELVGQDRFVETLAALGATRLHDGAYYGPSLALGTVDMPLWELVAAYRTLARGGLFAPLHLTPQPPEEGVRVLSAPAAYLTADILSDRAARGLTFGLDNPLGTRFWTAVKTGTSKDMRDNWCVGFSTRYTVGVWVGNFSGQPMWDVSGVTGAAPLWRELMHALHETDPGRMPRPDGVVEREVWFAADGVTRREIFMAGTETDRVEMAAADAAPHIVYPPDGAVLALDPDRDRNMQKVFFRAVGAGSGWRWMLDGRDAGAVPEHRGWNLQRGRHELALGKGDGSAARVTFVVR